jgi:carboxyl-terminal processing protease
VEKLMNGAISGLVRSLGDPHSMYISGDMFKQFMVATEGQFGGIGIVVGAKDELLIVVSPIEGTPGEAAGLKSGDRILKIDGEDTGGMPLDIAAGKIRGLKDTFVELEILTADGENKTLKIMRTNIKIKTVAGRKLADGMGYIRVTVFNEHTYDEIVGQLNKLTQEGVSGIVLDLRNNPGGLLDSSVKIAELFVPKGPVVSIAGRDGNKEVLYSNNPNPKYKLVVLVNEGSASASEIVAGALQDTGVGIVVGTTTYGKGSVQAVLGLDSDSAIKITVAEYYTPNGRTINGVGVKPDIELPRSEHNDNQLDKAIEVLREQMEKEKTKKAE